MVKFKVGDPVKVTRNGWFRTGRVLEVLSAELFCIGFSGVSFCAAPYEMSRLKPKKDAKYYWLNVYGDGNGESYDCKILADKHRSIHQIAFKVKVVSGGSK